MSNDVLLWTGKGTGSVPYEVGFNDPGNWLDVTTGKPATLPPGAGNAAIFGAGTISTTIMDNTANDGSVGTLVLASGAHLNLTGIPPSDSLNVGNFYLDPNASLNTAGARLDVGNLIVTSHSTVDLGSVPFSGFHDISNLWNVGGSVISTGNVLIGGPGFVQDGLATPGEMNVHAGANGWIDLGNVAQGSSVASVVELLQNASHQDITGVKFADWSDGGFTFNGFGGPTSGALPSVAGGTAVGEIGVNTAKLGAHVGIITTNAGYSMAIVDNVVKA